MTSKSCCGGGGRAPKGGGRVQPAADCNPVHPDADMKTVPGVPAGPRNRLGMPPIAWAITASRARKMRLLT